MGYHDGREIPNYWAYAKAFVLQDHMFEPGTLFKVIGRAHEPPRSELS